MQKGKGKGKVWEALCGFKCDEGKMGKIWFKLKKTHLCPSC